jgi:ATP-dependent Clp protease protease subunit
MKLFITLLIGLTCTLAHAHSPVTSKKKTIILSSKNTVIMNKPFTDASVANVQQKLAKLSEKSKRPLYLVLDSPGGSISAGQSLIDFANALPNKVHTITLFAASMAYLTAQHLDRRYVISSARLMSHRARISGLGGQVPGEANSRLHHIGSIVQELLKSTAKRVGVSYNEYLGSIYDELWLTAQQSVERNHADEIVNVKCDKSLNGTYYDTVVTFFGEFRVTYSRCPLIRGPLKIGAQKGRVSRRIKRRVRKSLQHEKRKYFDYTL